MIIGIDPGSTGGIAFLFNDGSVDAVTLDKKTRLDVLEMIETAIQTDQNITGIPSRTSVRAVIEKVSPMPAQGGRKMGAVSAFKFGQNYEMHLSMMTALKIPFELVGPKEWQKGLSLTKPKDYKEGKEYLRQKAGEIHPDLMYGKTLGYQRAVCDALLIVEFGRKKSLDRFTDL